MALNKEPFKNWFGFTRRERRSAFMLLLIIILIIVLRYTVPEKNIAIEDLSFSVSGTGASGGFLNRDSASTGQLFSFDPNTASYDTLIKLGLAVKEASTLIKYRNKGGKFRNPSDIKKIYGIKEEKVKQLMPFVAVVSDTSLKFRTKTYRQQKPLLDLNRCDSLMLVRLPGIGPVLSARIIKYRRLIGGFARTDQLKEVYGLPEETYNLIKNSLYADTSTIIRISVNSAEYKELSHIPYIEKYEVAAILKYRELKGRINGISDLTENKLITEAKAGKIRPYLRFE